jgi:hypothetical protein
MTVLQIAAALEQSGFTEESAIAMAKHLRYASHALKETKIFAEEGKDLETIIQSICAFGTKG